MAGVYADTSNIVDGLQIDAADVKPAIDALDTELARRLKSARVFRSTDQTLTTAVVAAIAFDSERFDTDTIHDNVTNNTRLTCKTAGKYIIGATALFASNATGIRELYIQLNGVTKLGDDMRSGISGTNFPMSLVTFYQLAVNDYVELIALQTSGGNLNVLASPSSSCEFWMVSTG